MVLELGHIIERGSHDELIAQKGRYYTLYTGNFAEDPKNNRDYHKNAGMDCRCPGIFV